MWSSSGVRWDSSSTIPCSPAAAAVAVVDVAAAVVAAVDAVAAMVADAVVAVDTDIKAPTGLIPRINF